MLSEIGSSFWIDSQKQYSLIDGLSPDVFGIYGSDFAWLSTGRSAITMALECDQSIRKQKKLHALLPAYTCESVIEPFFKKGYTVDFYSLNENLEADYEEIKSIVAKTDTDVFLFHRYFGFDTAKGITEVVDYCRERGIAVIEDRTQCLYSDIPLSNADYYVGSIRKWCETPDGGFIVCRQNSFEKKPTERDYDLERAKLIASYGKYDFLFNGKGDKSTYLTQFAEAEELLEKRDKIYHISDYSLAIQGALNIQDLKAKRRENYKVMVKGIESVDGIKVMFDVLPDGITPLYLPLLVENRQEVQLKLRNEAIYAPVIWPKAECIDCKPETKYLYEHMLCIPIDQRYGTDDMQRIVDCLNEGKK